MMTSEVTAQPRFSHDCVFPARTAAAFQSAVGEFAQSYIGGRLTSVERDELFRAVDALLVDLPDPAPPPEAVIVALKQLIWSCVPVIASPLSVRRKVLEVLVADCIDVYFARARGRS